jgi:cytoskeletal protein RodZ
MNQQIFGQKTGPDTAAGSGGTTAPAVGAGKPAASGGKAANTHQAVLGPFTIRDLAVFAGTLILFIASLLPIFGGRYNLWNLNNLFFLGLGIVLPLVVSALFAARRLAPGTKIRMGSLSIDQFASVVASFAVAFFFLSVAIAYVPSLLVGLIGALVLFVVTVLGRFLPYVSPDFQGRAEAPAHVVAREAAIPVQKPRAPKKPKTESAASKPASGGGLFSGAGAGSSAVQPDATAHTPATAAVPTSGAAAAGTPAARPAPVSTAPEASDSGSAGDSGPATQAADVVRPASVPAAEETQLADIPASRAAASGAGASSIAGAAPHAGPESAGNHDGAPAASAAQGSWEPSAATAVHPQVRADVPIGATVDPSSRPEESDEQPIHEAFWFAVAQHRTAFDPRTGAPAFVIEPGGWVLALEDRGHEFLVQHTDGRLGVLRDLSNIERG